MTSEPLRPAAPGAARGRSPAALHRRPGPIALVAVGGTLGSAVRAALAGLAADADRPWAATASVNVTGAFLLGVLLERLARAGPDEGSRRGVRLLLGTGVLGGYTTYSALALETVQLAAAGHVGGAALYAAGSVVLGVVAAAAGVATGARLRHPAGAP